MTENNFLKDCLARLDSNPLFSMVDFTKLIEELFQDVSGGIFAINWNNINSRMSYLYGEIVKEYYEQEDAGHNVTLKEHIDSSIETLSADGYPEVAKVVGIMFYELNMH